MHSAASPHRVWLIASIIIAGIIVGYSISLSTTPSAFSSPLECPVACTGDNCPMVNPLPTFEK